METIKIKENELNESNEIKAIKSEFKDSLKNEDFMPHNCSTYGTKYDGSFQFEHFIFYAMLKNKDIRKVTHDKDSIYYRYTLAKIAYMAFESNKFLNLYNFLHRNMEASEHKKAEYINNKSVDKFVNKNLKEVMPTLTIEIFKDVVQNYFNSNKDFLSEEFII